MTAQELQHSASYAVATYRSEPGKETELGSKLSEFAKMAQAQPGVVQVNVYRLLSGPGPTYAVVAVAENPGVIEKMARDQKFHNTEKSFANLFSKRAWHHIPLAATRMLPFHQ